MTINLVIKEYKLINKNGVSVIILSYGGIIKEINTPDRNKNIENIVLGYNNNQQYLDDDFYLGALIGRYANRIYNGVFNLNRASVKLERNEKNNHLHGGNNGFHKKQWELEEYDAEKKYVKLKMFSNDLEGGYPGNLTAFVKYTLNQNNELIIEICGKSDKDTIYNPTSHSYFNLNPSQSSILNHKLKINSTKYIPVNEECIPTGKQENSKNTPFDFSLKKEIGKEINNDNEQLRNGNGYDHCYVLNTNNHISAELSDQISGRKLMITTDQPGIQLYSGNHLRGKFIKNEGVCLETQHFPDSPNNKTFPSTILKANEEYYTKTIYSFGII